MVAYASSFGADPIFIQCLVAAAQELIDNKYMVYKVLLDIPMEVAMKRITKRDLDSDQKKQELFENDKTLLHVNSIYQDKELRLFNKVVNANQGVGKVFVQLKKILCES
jgi:thymidylate kinase